MAGRAKSRKPPPTDKISDHVGLQRFPIGGNFQGGVNLQDSPQEIETFESFAAQNIAMRFGSIEERKGKTRLGAFIDDLGYIGNSEPWYAGNATRLMLSLEDGSVWEMSGTGVMTNRIAAGSNQLWDFVASQDATGADKLWMMDGVTAPKKMSTAGVVSAWANNPPMGNMLTVWQNHMCVAGVAATPQRLFYSDIGNPESPAAAYGTNWVDIKSTDDDLDPITWIQNCGPYLLVFKRQSVWAVVESTGFTNHRVGTPGCEARWQGAEVEGLCYYFSRNGLWSTDGARPPHFEGRNVERYLVANLNYAQMNRVRVHATRDRHVMCAVPIGSAARNNRIFEYLLPLYYRVPGTRRIFRTPWMIHDYGVACMSNFRPAGTVDYLVAGSSTLGVVYRLFDGTNDDGAAIDAFWQTGWTPIVQMEPYERVRRVNVEMSGEVSVELYQDFASVPKASARLSAGGASADPLWDGGPWEPGIWDPNSTTALRRFRPESRGAYHSLRFHNSVKDTTFSVVAAELAIRGGKEKEEGEG